MYDPYKDPNCPDCDCADWGMMGCLTNCAREKYIKLMTSFINLNVIKGEHIMPDICGFPAKDIPKVYKDGRNDYVYYYHRSKVGDANFTEVKNAPCYSKIMGDLTNLIY